MLPGLWDYARHDALAYGATALLQLAFAEHVRAARMPQWTHARRLQRPRLRGDCVRRSNRHRTTASNLALRSAIGGQRRDLVSVTGHDNGVLPLRR